MGVVYKAYDPTLDRHVAIKVLAAHLAGEERFVQRFLREARAAAKLDHPNIVTIHEVGQEDNVYYFVMAYLPGEPLTQLISERGQLPLDTVFAIAEQVAAALDYAHERGLVHRDIKPSNIVVDENGRAVLTDFGLVQVGEGSRLTATGMLLGTPEYMSPEQALGGEATRASDIYGLGVIVYEMLAGDVPFQAQTPVAVLMKQAREAPPSLRARNHAVSAELEEVVMWALSKDPFARPVSGAAFIQALKSACGGLEKRIQQEVPPAVDLVPASTREPAPFSSAPPAAAVHPSALAVESPTQPSVQAGELDSPPTLWQRVPLWIWILGGVVALAWLVILTILLVGALREPPAALVGQATPTVSPAETSTGTVKPIPSLVTATTTSRPTPLPTATPSPEPTEVPPSPTPQPTNTVRPTARILPTATSPPTATPTATITPTPTPTCTPATGDFADIWEVEQERLGCPRNEVHESWLAQEHFENGQMFWREDTDTIPVLYNDGSWALYPDLWEEGDPDFACPESAPSESPPTPTRGFGTVWCTYPEVREGLGWATDRERGFYGTVQDFDSGVIIRLDTGATYVLFGAGDWITWP